MMRLHDGETSVDGGRVDGGTGVPPVQAAPEGEQGHGSCAALAKKKEA